MRQYDDRASKAIHGWRPQQASHLPAGQVAVRRSSGNTEQVLLVLLAGVLPQAEAQEHADCAIASLHVDMRVAEWVALHSALRLALGPAQRPVLVHVQVD